MKFFLLIKSGGIALGLTLIITVITTTPSWAVSNCTLADFKGSYGYSEQGVVIKDSTQRFIAEAGIMTADGQGHFSAKSSGIWAPFPFPVEQPLTFVFSTRAPGEGYTVNRNCTGEATFSITVTDRNGSPVPLNPINGSNVISGRTLHFVLDNPNKSEIKFVSTTPGFVTTGSANKQ